MLQRCANPNCSTHYAEGIARCPACGTPPLAVEVNSAPSVLAGRRQGGDLTPQQRRGRNLLGIYLVIILLLDLGTSILMLGLGLANVIPRTIRLTVTILICSALYSGNLKAKRVSSVLFALGTLIGLAGVLLAGISTASILGLAIAAVYGSFVFVLEFSPSVNAFMEYQRGGPDKAQLEYATASVEIVLCPMCGATMADQTAKCPHCGEEIAGLRA
jgi:hypothetical protein